MGQEPDQIRERIEQTRARWGRRSMRSATRPTCRRGRRTRSQTALSELGIRWPVQSAPSRTRQRRRCICQGRHSRWPAGFPGRARCRGSRAAKPSRAGGQRRRGGIPCWHVLPSSRVEDERIGAIADEVKEHAAAVGQEALEHGKQIAKDVAQTAASTAEKSATQHADELRTTAAEHAQAVTGDSPSST